MLLTLGVNRPVAWYAALLVVPKGFQNPRVEPACCGVCRTACGAQMFPTLGANRPVAVYAALLVVPKCFQP
jgi:hypothetical protein